METTTFDNQLNNEMMEPARPQFLSVLCILTWIMCAITFVSTLSGIVMKPSVEKQMEQIEQLRSVSPEAAEKMEAMLENQSGTDQAISTLITLLSLALSAYGAFLMWKLKKTGFFLYITGELIWYVSLAFGGAQALEAAGAMSGMGSAVIGVAVGVFALFDIIFIAMYGANVKYMKA